MFLYLHQERVIISTLCCLWVTELLLKISISFVKKHCWYCCITAILAFERSLVVKGVEEICLVIFLMATITVATTRISFLKLQYLSQSNKIGDINALSTNKRIVSVVQVLGCLCSGTSDNEDSVVGQYRQTLTTKLVLSTRV